MTNTFTQLLIERNLDPQEFRPQIEALGDKTNWTEFVDSKDTRGYVVFTLNRYTWVLDLLPRADGLYILYGTSEYATNHTGGIGYGWKTAFIAKDGTVTNIWSSQWRDRTDYRRDRPQFNYTKLLGVEELRDGRWEPVPGPGDGILFGERPFGPPCGKSREACCKLAMKGTEWRGNPFGGIDHTHFVCACGSEAPRESFPTPKPTLQGAGS